MCSSFLQAQCSTRSNELQQLLKQHLERKNNSRDQMCVATSCPGPARGLDQNADAAASLTGRSLTNFRHV